LVKCRIIWFVFRFQLYCELDELEPLGHNGEYGNDEDQPDAQKKAKQGAPEADQVCDPLMSFHSRDNTNINKHASASTIDRFINLRVLLVLTDGGILAQSN
jgi:hypothetical protein